MNRALALVAVVLLVVSAGAPALASASTPGGDLASVPDSNVRDDLPAQANGRAAGPPGGLPTAAAFRGSAMASAHADTLEVTVTTTGRTFAPDSAGRGELAIKLSDDVHHDGRQVALNASAIREYLGYTPETATVTHESGEQSQVSVTREGSLLVFDVARFSSNVVTFGSTVSIQATPATDGSSYSYDLDDLDAVENYSVNVTGNTAEEWDNVSATGVAPDSTRSISVDGNLAPTGPSANDEPMLEVTGNEAFYSEYDGSSTKGMFIAHTDTGTAKSAEQYYETPPATVESLNMSLPGCYNCAGLTVDIYMLAESPDGVYGEGTLVKDNWVPSSGTGWKNITLDAPYSTGGASTTVEFVVVDGGGSTQNTLNAYRDDGTGTWGSTNGDTNSYQQSVYLSSKPSGVDVSAGDGTSHAFGSFADGETKTVEFPVSTSATELNWSGTGGTLDYTLKLRERTQTADPAIEVNGQTTSHTGTLADGETAALTTNESWIQEGTNQVNVSVGDGTLSSDAPTPQVALDYTHGAQSNQSVEYVGDGWTESYNVSKTFASKRQDATLTVPFSETTYEVRPIERRVNGSSWETVASEDYSLDNTTLTVSDLDGDGDGSVDANTKVEIRVTGYRVQVEGGQITVTDATDASDNGLDTEFYLDSWSSGASIAVCGTPHGDRTHYTYKETWNQADEYAIVDSDGHQTLYLPNAQAGDSARVTTIPVELVPKDGDASVHVADPDGPTFTMGPGGASGDDVEMRYLAATSGETYELYSVSRGRVVDKDTADSPAIFVEDDSEETLRIRLASSDDDGGGDGTGSVGGGGVWAQTGPATTLQEFGVVGGWAALVLVLIAATGRSTLAGRERWLIVGATSLGTGLLSVEVLRPGIISGALGSGLQEVVPLAGLAAVGLVGYTVVSWWQSRKQEAATPETKVSFDLGRSK